MCSTASSCYMQLSCARKEKTCFPASTHVFLQDRCCLLLLQRHSLATQFVPYLFVRLKGHPSLFLGLQENLAWASCNKRRELQEQPVSGKLQQEEKGCIGQPHEIFSYLTPWGLMLSWVPINLSKQLVSDPCKPTSIFLIPTPIFLRLVTSLHNYEKNKSG